MSRSLRLTILSIISLSVLLAFFSSGDDVLTVDEIPHVGAGYSYLVNHNTILNPEHPPLVKDLAALPLLTLDLNQKAFSSDYWNKDDAHLVQYEFARELIYHSGNDADLITRVARLPMLLFLIVGALLLAQLTFELYGSVAALLAVILFCFSPTIIAHSRFVTTDIPAMTGVLASIYLFLKYLKSPSTKNLVATGVVLGLALLTKFSTLALLPFLAFVFLAYLLIHRLAKKESRGLIIKTGLLIGIAFAVVWGVYQFHTIGYPADKQLAFAEQTLRPYGDSLIAKTLLGLSANSITRPFAQFFLGALLVIQHNQDGHPAYFLGTVSSSGWWYYFPIVYFIKEPLAWWIFVAVACTAGIYFALNRQQSHRSDKVPKALTWLRANFWPAVLGSWLVFYWVISIKSSINIGVRHLLPTYPFAIALVSGQIARLYEYTQKKSIRYRRFFTITIVVLLSWYIWEAVAIYPYYLAYFNQSVGGAEGGYRYVADSNVDWGQDLKRFARWVNSQDIPGIEVAYFSGWADPSYYLGEKFQWLTEQKYKDAEDFKKRNASGGWLAISVQFLQTVPAYSWLKAYTPVAKIGYSIFVYKF